MMTAALPLMLTTLLTAGLPVEVSSLSGNSVTGDLALLTETGVVLEVDGERRELPRADLLELSVTRPSENLASTNDPLPQAVLGDGGRLSLSEFTVAGRSFQAVMPLVGNVSLALSEVKAIRLQPRDGKVEQTWQELLSRETRSDMLVIRKGDVLDYLDGVVGEVDAATVKFLLDGDEIPVKRERVFGWIYAGRDAAAPTKGVRVETMEGSRFFAESLTFDETGWQVRLRGSRETATVAPDALSSLDFSLGKLAYLSRMEPREESYTPYFDIVWPYRRDRHLDGGPISIDKIEYRRGLSIHSRSLLRYRLGREYRRFLAVAGIDDVVRPRGDLTLRISGDGRVLYEGRIQGIDPPLPLDLDVSDVRDLEIFVDFGENHDFQDHLDLGNARVTK